MAVEQLALDDKATFARRFDDLHELLYRRGGIRPVNAAIDEVCKLLLVRIHSARHPNEQIGGVPLARLMSGSYLTSLGDTAPGLMRSAFAVVNAAPEYHAGSDGGFFLEGDTLRLTDPTVLAQAVDLVASIPVPGEHGEPADALLAEEDIAGLAFEVFLRGKYEHGGGLGTYLTPAPVVEAMTSMALDLIPAGRLTATDLLVGDPCCGTARFLIAAMRQVEARQRRQGHADTTLVEQLRQTAFFGADQSDSSLLKARLNFLMYGVESPRLFRVDDSITSPHVQSLVGQFDAILTNPPFGEGKYDRPDGLAAMRSAELETVAGWSRRRGHGSPVPADRADPAILFWDFNLTLLRPGGVLGIVLPDGALGPSYSWLHDALVRGIDGRPPKAELMAVVSLPRHTFALAGTVAKTSFAILRRLPSDQPRRRVFVAHAEHVGYLQRGGQLLTDHRGDDLASIAPAFGDSLNDSLRPDTRWALLPMSAMDRSIDANGQSGPAEAGRPTLGSIASTRKKRSRSRRPEDAYFLSILHVGSDCLVDWVAASDYSPITPGRECNEGDVLVSCLNPQIPRVTFIPPGAGSGLCSAEFAVLHSDTIDPATLALLVRSDETTAYLAAAGRGTSSSRRRIDAGQLLAAPLPAVTPPLDVVDSFRDAISQDRLARESLARVLASLRSAPSPVR